jgi:hypothetical protein
MQQVQLWTCCLAIGAWLVAPCRAADSTAKDVFEQRIMPIFKSPNPSSLHGMSSRGRGLEELHPALAREDVSFPATNWILTSARDPKLRSAAKLAPAEVAKPTPTGSDSLRPY